MKHEIHELSNPAPKTVRELRAKAHALKPVVWISQKGMSEGALREVDRALSAHELIKIHAALDDRPTRETLLNEICRALEAQPVQVLGKMLVAYRVKPKPAETAPAKGAPGGKTPARAKRTQRAAAPAKKARRATRPARPATRSR